MGANKDYPPPLPDREDYVVEFDGPEDPLYPQNWELGTKYAFPTLSRMKDMLVDRILTYVLA